MIRPSGWLWEDCALACGQILVEICPSLWSFINKNALVCGKIFQESPSLRLQNMKTRRENVNFAAKKWIAPWIFQICTSKTAIRPSLW